MNMHRVGGGDNIGIRFCAMPDQQTHIRVPWKLSCCVDVYVGAQRPHNQQCEEVDLGCFGQLPHQSKLEEVFGNLVS